MILRIWHGWTTPENADEYERLLTEEIFPDIAAETGDELLGYEVGRREGGDDDGGDGSDGDGGDGSDGDESDGEEVAFVTIMRFESEDAVEALVGEDYERAHIPDSAREVLKRWDDRVRHYEVRDTGPD